MERIRLGQPEGHVKIVRKDGTEHGLVRLSNEQLNKLLIAERDKTSIIIKGDGFELSCRNGRCSKAVKSDENNDYDINKEETKMSAKDEINKLVNMEIAKGMNEAQAVDKVLSANPELYERYTLEQMTKGVPASKKASSDDSGLPGFYELKLTQLAKELQAKEGLSFEGALDRACLENPELYERYDAERRR